MTIPVGTEAIAVRTEQGIVLLSKHSCHRLLDYPVNDRWYSERSEFVAVGFWYIYSSDRLWFILFV